MRSRAIAACLSAWLVVGCQDSLTGFLSCGVDVCSAREACVESSSGAACQCAEGFEGENCSVCSSGYRAKGANECVLIPIDCEAQSTVCGLHGACVSDPSGNRCDCDENYAGRLCELCESGYQDNDSDGTCRATCAEADLSCKAPSRCSDARGTAVCECPTGYTGDDCSRCALGYRDTGTACVLTCAAQAPTCNRNQLCVDGPTGARCECAEGYASPTCLGCAVGFREDPSTGSCLPACDGGAEACGEHGRCDDSAGFARCVCALGYAGTKCAQCAEDYASAAGGRCQRAPTPEETQVMIASYQSRPVIASIDPSRGAVVPLAEGAFTGLASAGAAHTLFVNRAGTISRLSTSASDALKTAVSNSGAVGPLAWDETGERLYALTGKAPYRLLSIDPATKVVLELFDTGLAGAADLAFDAARNRVLVLRDSLFGVSLVDGAVTALGALPPATMGIEVRAGGGLFALAATDADEAASRVDACRATASRLGLAGYAGATGRFVQPGDGADSVSLSAASPDEPEVLSYVGRGAEMTPRTLEIEVQNPRAVICLAIEEASLIHLGEDALFRALVIYSSAHEVELSIEAPIADEARIFLGGYAPKFAYAERDDVVLYTPAEWASLELPVDMRFHQPGPGVLHTLDAALAIERSVALSGSAIPAGALSDWTPVAP